MVMDVGKQDLNPLSANPTNWSNTFKQFIGNSQRIVWVCLTMLLDWRLKGLCNTKDTFSTKKIATLKILKN